MPGLIAGDSDSRKRKSTALSNGAKSRKAPKTTNANNDSRTRILMLEEQILESREHYNNIVELQRNVQSIEKKPKTAIVAAVALCRVFCRLIAGEQLAKQDGVSEAEGQIVKWLRARLRDYTQTLTGWIGSPDATQEDTALTLLMRIVKEEVSGGSRKAEQAWRSDKSTFVALVQALLDETEGAGARQDFVSKYVEEHDDIRFFTFAAIRQCIEDHNQSRVSRAENALDLLSHMEGVPESEDQLEDWYTDPRPGEKNQLWSLKAHQKVAREAWLAVFRSPLSSEYRKKILGIITSQILPWFAGHIELLADFLTDSFNQGGSTSLLALSGIFNMMTQKNLDYPDFYTKLYSLLDEDVLHSKHRSRFFRLLDTFLSSTHLPSAMVASFMKRLARLSLQSPPGGIVWIVPWIYNTLKQHPPCTFMLHRTYHPAHAIYAKHSKYEEEGMDDPFDMNQKDPMLTGAIDSSFWELETLQSHYHPNVATLAKILSEQFTKRDYHLEDFSDHSYASLADAELGKAMKKAPVVEWEIPKRILTADDGNGLNDMGNRLQTVMSAS